MGLFSKIFGDNSELKSAIESAAKEVLNDSGKTLKDFTNAMEGVGSVIKENGGMAPVHQAPAGQTYSESGWSWGEEMPAEANQFNYPGSYVEYFDHVFRTEFPEYRITCEQPKYDGTLFIFWQGPQRALVVELLPQHSAAAKLRKDCLSSGIPYLRYYYDHDGWWNTYSYVRDRTRTALGG